MGSAFTSLLCYGAGELPAKGGGALGHWNEGVAGGYGVGGVDGLFPTHRETAAMNGAPGYLSSPREFRSHNACWVFVILSTGTTFESFLWA